MFYKKNVGMAERIVRAILGVGLAAAGFASFGSGALALLLVASGAIAIGTGLIGFCPACALVGRRALEERER